ncbi:hypothetical protein E2C01_013843 [Portunus trituberculatus]|uniref:Uncharacterized protein n=1 Tax=Portunus trituberculatus TaxID=210409 RepID=A0A5B7DHP6_PORTR|nr:hypothetical protein [Portunus trituberculatus]
MNMETWHCTERVIGRIASNSSSVSHGKMEIEKQAGSSRVFPYTACLFIYFFHPGGKPAKGSKIK